MFRQAEVGKNNVRKITLELIKFAPRNAFVRITMGGEGSARPDYIRDAIHALEAKAEGGFSADYDHARTIDLRATSTIEAGAEILESILNYVNNRVTRDRNRLAVMDLRKEINDMEAELAKKKATMILLEAQVNKT